MQIQIDSNKSTGERYGLAKEFKELSAVGGLLVSMMLGIMLVFWAGMHFFEGGFVLFFVLGVFGFTRNAFKGTIPTNEYTGPMP
jgi:hypothetical protein